ncbi:MAG: hypothetical protein JKY54_01275 [Flavobacteriales bacterium]|nr:hypothetical protein [Flavobacteriales bacterium]
MKSLKTVTILLVLSLSVLISCELGEKNESTLSAEDLKLITEIIPFSEGETIQMFESNGGFQGLKASGNFITNLRLAAYWIDGKNDLINSIEYKEIDSLKTIDRVTALTYASYLQVYSSEQSNFKVYIDADSTRTWAFFNLAIESWNSNK